MTAVAQTRFPDATLVLPHGAPRHKWLAMRKLGIGGSDASTIAGVNRWSSRYALWLDKTDRLPDRAATARMEAGVRMEPVMRTWFEDEQGIAVEQVGTLQSKARPWQLVNLDGVCSDGGIFESKATNWRMAEEWDDEQVADHAEVQVQHGLAVTGASHAWVVALIDGWDFRIRRIDRDQALIETLTAMESEFWHANVLADVEPAIEPMALDAIKQRYSDADEDAVALASPDEIEPLLAEHRAAAAALKAASDRKDIAEAGIRALLAGAVRLDSAGRVIATCKPVTSTRLDGKRLASDHPDLAAEYRTSTTYRRLTIKKDN